MGAGVSGPLHERDNDFVEDDVGVVEVREGRIAEVGGMGIVRVLPTKGRRTIGGWCFVDLMTPGDVANPPRLEIGPHPHIGLATVTWLFEGTALHGDSLGTEQLIRPSQLNLMTAGRGIAHAELGIQGTGLGTRVGELSGAQMWIAQPEATRHGGSAFQHIDEIPMTELGTAEGQVFIGSIGNAHSPAQVDSQLIGLDLTLRPSAVLPANPRFEYGIIPLDRPIQVAGSIVEPGFIGILTPGQSEVALAVDGGQGRALVLGGEPLGESVQMWWNFVARTKDEITEAWRDWRDHNDDRFGAVPSELPRIDAPTPPWVRQG